MKAVTLPIAFVVLIAFGDSLAWCSSSSGSPYQELKRLLQINWHKFPHENEIAIIDKFIHQPEFKKKQKKFRHSAKTFALLVHGAEDESLEVCSLDKLNVLRKFINEAVKCNVTIYYPMSQWDKINLEVGAAGRRVLSLNSTVPFLDLPRFIFRHPPTPESGMYDNREFEKIIRDALLAGEKDSLMESIF